MLAFSSKHHGAKVQPHGVASVTMQCKANGTKGLSPMFSLRASEAYLSSSFPSRITPALRLFSLEKQQVWLFIQTPEITLTRNIFPPLGVG